MVTLILSLTATNLFLDSVRYTKNDWRNRNQIKSANGAHWLTVPCGKDISKKRKLKFQIPIGHKNIGVLYVKIIAKQITLRNMHLNLLIFISSGLLTQNFHQ